jgi:hypothetical protein
MWEGQTKVLNCFTEGYLDDKYPKNFQDELALAKVQIVLNCQFLLPAEKNIKIILNFFNPFIYLLSLIIH